MTTIRRRIIRPPRELVAAQRDQRQLEKRRAKLVHERAGLDRWMSRLRRAFNAVEKQRRKVARLEGQVAQLESV